MGQPLSQSSERPEALGVKRPSVLSAEHLDQVRPLGYVAERYRAAASSSKPPPQ